MGKKTGTTTQSVAIPPEVLARYNAVNTLAEQTAATPFQKYTGQFVAPLTATQQQGMAATQAASNMAQPYYQQAQSAITNAYGQATPMYGQSLNTMQSGIGQAMGQYGQALQGISGARDVGTQYADSARQGFQGAKGAAQPYMQQAGGLFDSALGQSNPLLAQAEGYLDGATKSISPTEFSGAEISKYMSPYQQQVIDAQQKLQAQESAQQRSALSSQAIGAGAFGGDRAGVAQANLARQQSMANQATMANILQQGYGQASQMFQQQQAVNLASDQANRAAQQFGSQQAAALGAQRFGQNLAAGTQQMGLGQALFGQDMATGQAMAGLGQQQYAQGLGAAQAQAGIGQNMFGMSAQQAALQQAAAQGIYGMGTQQAATLGQLGTGSQTAALQGAQATLAAGTLEQQTQQAESTAQYQQFLQERGYPFQIAQFLANIAMGTGALSGSTTTTQQPIPFMSDRRVKEDIAQVGETNDGQPIYRFKYKGEDQTHIGLIAQDVEKEHPEAVGSMNGIKTVDYKKATDGAVERADGGGVYPNSMGGVVSPSTVGEAFNRGGYLAGGLVDPNDISALLASQRESFGPFGPSPTQGGAPYGGKGVVPPGRLPTPKLITAARAPALPESQLKQAYGAFKDVNQAVKDFTKKDIPDRVRAAVSDTPAPKKVDSPSTSSADTPAPSVAAPPVAEEKGLLDRGMDWAKDLFSPSMADGGGVMSRRHYALGGVNPYEETTDPMKDVLEEQESIKTPELMKPGAPPPMPKSIMSDIMDVAKTAASIYAASDERIKKNKEQIGKLYDGQPVYRYDFGDDRTQLGLMAQEVERHNPDAVATHNSGVKMVNYDRATEDAAKRGKFAMGGVMPREGYEVGGPIDPADLPAVGAQDVEYAPNPLSSSIKRTAEKVGVDPVDLGTAISYETGGTFDPWKRGPTTKWGEHRGLIQWGEPQRQQYGVSQDSTPDQQMDAVGRYLVDRGVKPGMGLKDIYSAINAGGVGRYNASDEQAGGAPGTVADKVASMGDHRIKAAQLLGLDVGNASPRPPADLTGREPMPTSAPEAPSEGGGGVKSFWKENQGTILPILAGLGSMAESKSPFFAGALLSGIGGGARSYAEINKQLAEVAGTEMNTASAAMDVVRKTLSPKEEWVWVNGTWMDIMEANKLRREGKLKLPGGELAEKAIASAGERYAASIKSNIPKAGELVKPDEAKPSEPKPTKPPESVASVAVPVVDMGVERKQDDPNKPAYSVTAPALVGPKTLELAKNEIDASIGPGKAGNLARSSAYQASAMAQAEAARQNTINANEMAMAVSNHIGGKGLAAPGSFFPARKEAMNFGNTLVRGLGGSSVTPAVTYADLMDKVNIASAAERAKGAGFEARGSLEMLSRAEPNTKMDPDAQAQLAAQAMVYNRAAKERELHRIGYQKAAGTNTSVDAGTAFEADNRNRYNADINLLKHAVLYYPREMKAMVNQAAKPEQIEKFFYDIARRNKLTYYPGTSSYFVEGQ